jgi:hypothetical protein
VLLARIFVRSYPHHATSIVLTALPPATSQIISEDFWALRKSSCSHASRGRTLDIDFAMTPAASAQSAGISEELLDRIHISESILVR